MKKILIIGSGFLGKYILEELDNLQYEIFSTFNKKDNFGGIPMDISNQKMVKQVFDKINPDIVINCAANTNIDFLEDHPQHAFNVNSIGAKNVAFSCENHKSRLIHISTDSIFDGKHGMYKEEDVPNPINIYGKSKLEGEKFVQKFSSNYTIIRTNFFGFNLKQKFLFNWIVNSLKNEEKINGFDDVFFNPLEVSNLSEMIEELAINNYHGIIHLSSDDIFTKYQFAIKIAKEFQLNENLIKKALITDITFKAKRPLNTTLDNSKSKSLLKTVPNSLENSLKKIKRKYYKGIF